MFRRLTHRSARRFPRPSTSARVHLRGRSLAIEELEDRRVLTTTLFVDFGLAFAGGALTVSDAQLASPTLNGPQVFGASHTLNSLTTTLVNLNLDINTDGSVNAADAQAFGSQVLAVAQRILEPFDIIIQQANATNLADIANSLAANGSGLGNRDAYIVTAGDQPPANPAFGWALIDTNNTSDNLGFAFADDIIDTFDGSFSTKELVNAVVQTVVHEAGHTFGLVHTRAADNLLIAEGAIMGTPADLNADGDFNDLNEDQRNFRVVNLMTRFPLPLQNTPATTENAFDVLANPAVVGLKASAPLYITGTGAFDTINVINLGGGFANVIVNAFDSAARTTMLSTTSYVRSFANGIVIEGGLRDDRISIDATIAANVTVRGGAGLDELVVTGTGGQSGSYRPSGLAADAGQVTIAGGASITFSEFEPVVVSALANFTFTTPNSADVLTVDSPAAGQNRILGTSGGAAFESITFFNVTNFVVDMATNDGASPDDSIRFLAPGLAATGLATFTINGGPGNDLFRVRSSATAVINVNGGPPVNGDPGVPPGDALIVEDISGATFTPNSSDGTLLIPGRAPINYTSIETLIAPDRFEVNNSIAQATILGSDPFITLRDLSIHNADDEDFFRYTAHDTGKLIVRSLFDHDLGDIDMQILDSSGDVIASSSSVDDDEELIVPVVAQQVYFIRIFGVGTAINNYSLEIENFPVPAPTGVHLDPASDDGLLGNDNVTSDTTPTFFIQTDVLGFIDANGNGIADLGEIAALTAAQALAANVAGVAVEVTLVNTTTSVSITGFADPLIATIPEVYRFTPGVALTPGVYLVTARLKVFDGRQNPPGTPAPAMGRSTASPPLWITIDLAAADVIGPQITDVTVNNLTSAQFDLFDPKPTTGGPTPLVNTLRLAVQDLPNRIDAAGTINDFLDVALNQTVAMAPGNYLLVGDHVGVIAIQSVVVTNNTPVGGAPATASIALNFVTPLPDDRYTLTVRDHLIDPQGNKLDGESNAIQPLESPLFPSGDSQPGGDFVARFTIDSRPEIASYIPQQINIDINGNFVWDPANSQIGNDATNVDLTFTMGVGTGAAGTTAPGGFGVHDLVFAGKFLTAIPGAAAPTRVFDQLAVFGNAQDLGGFRWLVDRNSDGVVNVAQGDVLTLQPEGGLPGNFNVAGAIPVAGNFDGVAANGDEIGLYNAGRWALDTNRNFVIDGADTYVTDNLLGHPIVGDFDGDGLDDLAVFNNNTFSFDLRNNGFGGVDQTLIWGFPGVLDRPVAADMDQDGIDDIGLWVPRNNAQNPLAVAEWYFLVSNDRIVTDQPVKRVAGSIVTLNHPFEPTPFGHDLYAEFGNEQALPLVGNFDPPVKAASAVTQSSGDLDGDGDVDGGDFLAWQRKSAPSGAGLTQWRAGFGPGAAPAVHVEVASASTINALPNAESFASMASAVAIATAPVSSAPRVAAPAVVTPAPTVAKAAIVDAAIVHQHSHPRSVRSLVATNRILPASGLTSVVKETLPLTLEQRDDALFASGSALRHRALRLRR
jgi:hypothetical protein